MVVVCFNFISMVLLFILIVFDAGDIYESQRFDDDLLHSLYIFEVLSNNIEFLN